MIVTTTPNIEGKTITEYLGVVTGEAIMGANIFRDFFASITDIVGGRSAAYEKELGKARKVAMDEMTQKALDIGDIGRRSGSGLSMKGGIFGPHPD